MCGPVSIVVYLFFSFLIKKYQMPARVVGTAQGFQLWLLYGNLTKALTFRASRVSAP